MQLRSGNKIGSVEPTSNKKTASYISPSYKVLRSGKAYASHSGDKCFLAIRKFVNFHSTHPVGGCNTDDDARSRASVAKHKSYPDAYDFIEDMWSTFKPHVEELTNNPLYEKMKISLEHKITEFVENMEMDNALFYKYRTSSDKYMSLLRAYDLSQLYCTSH
jgi:hypothetical protein